jgi:DNA-binding response OmpR family regulator
MRRKQRVLVIDDDTSIGGFITTVLRSDDYDVTVTHRAELGLKGLAREGYQLVITDIFMDGMGGLELIEMVTAKLPNVRILAISGGFRNMTSEDTLDAAAKIGADAILAKPIDAEYILSKVTELLEI